jgi:K+-sensing histidine kinase KdpD
MRLRRYILRRSERGYIRSIGLALFCVAIAFLVRLALSPLGAPVPFATFFPAVLFAAVAAGRTAGVTAIVLSLLAGWWAFTEPIYSFVLPTSDALLGFGLFVLSAGLIVWLAQRYRQILFELQDSERQREVLADEVHHRAKNVVHLITSLVGQTVSDKDQARTLTNRIRDFRSGESASCQRAAGKGFAETA